MPRRNSPANRHELQTSYPFSDDGSFGMKGEGEGEGYNINVLWENGKCGDADYIADLIQWCEHRNLIIASILPTVFESTFWDSSASIIPTVTHENIPVGVVESRHLMESPSVDRTCTGRVFLLHDSGYTIKEHEPDSKVQTQ
ncbi:hypothetical protein L2E82_25339 [Cichorium intybus]|uniref:Uncharacterized protein n=1 Tax=Cichorium intybus TaxID=13427 RepID=A0ACB9E3M5_CICIN|nr:hypothetical protein L2E82_25339 [Cichorium intybus]